MTGGITTNPAPGGTQTGYAWRITKAVYVGTSSVLALLYVYGTLKVQGHIDFVQNGTESGVVLQVGGVTKYQIVESKTFTATGGNVKVSNGAKYNTGLLPSVWASSGAYTNITISCGNVSTPLPGDLSIVNSSGALNGNVTGSGAPIQNFNNITLSTGATFNFGTGFTVVARHESLKFNTLTAPATGAKADCKIRGAGYPLYGR